MVTYALGREPEEYERLRAQAQVWQPATARLLEEVGLGPGERRLDAGCGPGEAMRLMAERVGSAGSVHGIDVDASLGDIAVDPARQGLRLRKSKRCSAAIAPTCRLTGATGAPVGWSVAS